MRVVRWWWLWCAFLPSLLLSQTGSVPADFHVAESRMKLLLSPSVRLQLPLESHAGKPTSARIYLEILRADDGLVARTEADVTIAPGSHTLDIPWEKVLSAEPQPDYYWYRLRYKIVPADHQLPEQQGIVQLSQIVPAVFRMQVSGLKRPQRGSMLPVRVHVDDPRTGKGHAGVQVEAVWDFDDQEKRPAPVQGSTDSHGNATLTMKVPRAIDSDAIIRITARKDTWQRTENIELELKERFNVSLTTDKPIYQPGQLLHMRALVLGADDHALSRANVTFTINSPDEDEVFTKEAQTSEFGVAQVDWQIPQKIRIGDYGIKAGVDDSNPSTFAQVRISRYELPQFTVNATADKSYYLPGEPARVEVNAGYLFGQPVKRGTVRIVRSGERSWNREKREYQQEDKEIQQGELDSSGKFTAALDLKTDFQDLNNKDYLRYQDVRLAAYVTDLSTNRTEQRHFTVRTSKDRIHIYAFGYSAGPPDLFITTAFPDGAPASADVTITAVHAGPLDGIPQPGPARQEIGRIHTNKYGVGHFHSNALLRFFKDTRFSRLELLMEATDRHGNHGAHSEQIWSSGDEYLRITALHALLRDGESINASIESSLSEEQIYVDALSDGKVLATRKVRLRHGHAGVEFPYQQEFRKSVLLVAYKPDFSDDERSMIAAAEVLFPEPQDLDPGVHLQRATYRPGEPALAKFRVRSPEGKPVRSALGIVVYDKAVAERVRSDQEFGRYGFDYDNRWDGYNRIAGVTYRNLLNRKLTAPVPPDLELLAEAVLANSDSSQDFGMFAEGDRSYDWDASRIFGSLISRRVGYIENLLNFIYNSSYVCPKDMAELRHTLSANGVNLDDLRDPWGMPYRAEFSLKDRDRVLEFMSSGPDKLPNTADDFVALKITRPYFELIGRKMNAVLQEYASDGKYIRDFETLSRALQLKGIDLKSLKDPWGNTYAFDFGVEGPDYVIHVRSAGPNGVFAQPGARVSDDVREWTSFTRYFQHETGLLNAALADHFRHTGHFPAGENELPPVLNAAGLTADALLDPWGRPYHFRFREMSQYSDHISIYQATGDAQRETSVTPVTQKLGVIEIVSYGEKNDPGQGFPVATFYRVLSEQSAASPLPEAVSISQVPGTGGSGAISGTVTDPQGAVIAGAGVRATDTYTGQQYVTTTDGNGHYELNNLPAGRYQVVISSPGFMTSVIAAVPVSSSNLTRVDARLSIGTTSATVEVSAQAFQVETTSSMVTVSRHDHNVHVQAEQQAFTPRVRKYFPETLVWNPELVTDQSGNAELIRMAKRFRKPQPQFCLPAAPLLILPFRQTPFPAPSTRS